MNTKIRSIGFAAVGAIALTFTSVQDSRQPDTCADGYRATAKECQFESLLWELVRNSPDATDLKAYIEMFPNGRYLRQAKDRLSGRATNAPVTAQTATQR
jgi:hypothetical protein